MLSFTALFSTLLLAVQLGRFTKLRFSLSWWAYPLPLAVITIASLTMCRQTDAYGYLYLGLVLLLVLTGVVVLLQGRTLGVVREQRICMPDG